MGMPVRRVVIDHVAVGVSDLPRSIEFYTRALAPLGFEPMGSSGDGDIDMSFGVDGLDDFVISLRYPVGPGVHVCFAADSDDQVDAFYVAALAAGGRDNGAPGLRAEYSEGYYAAFVLDPDGHNIEAVHHR
jgi:catechol 2,3-dioxygenase-like lactoylglutathione lyase family enzyme